MDDLSSAKAVIANGGMSLIGEAIYLAKPMLSVPVREHFEQAMNARYLDALGFGMHGDLFDQETIGAFLKNIPRIKERLMAMPQQDGNRQTFEAVDQAITA